MDTLKQFTTLYADQMKFDSIIMESTKKLFDEVVKLLGVPKGILDPPEKHYSLSSDYDFQHQLKSGLLNNYPFQQVCSFKGLPVYPCEWCYKVVGLKQIRKHKRPRINKKWAKRYGFNEIREYEIWRVFDKLYVHPVMYHKIKMLNDQEKQMNDVFENPHFNKTFVKS